MSTDKATTMWTTARMLGVICAAILPFAVSALVWGSGVNERIAKHDEKIVAIEKDTDRREKVQERDRVELMTRLDRLSQQMDDVLRNLPRR